MTSKVANAQSFQLQAYTSAHCVLPSFPLVAPCCFLLCLPHFPQVMQNIGNLTPEVDAKELFMRPMIPFIQESIGRAKQYILDLIQIDQKLGEPYCDRLCLLVQHYTILVNTLGLCYT